MPPNPPPPHFRVVLLNDDEHTYGYVLNVLQLLLGYTPEEAFRLAREVDRTGRVVVCTAPLARAERVKAQIECYGPDPVLPHCRGSMRVELEPAG